MGYASGIAAQLGFAAESTVGTQVTVDHFVEHAKAPFKLEQKWAKGRGLRVGGLAPRAARVVQTTRGAKGTVELDVPTNKIGLLIRHLLGSPVTAPTQIAATTAYKQVHYVGNPDGLGLTLQVGRPQVSDGTVKPFTYPGSKIVGFELACSEGELLTLKLEVDAKDELTLATTPASNALAAASYVATTEVFRYIDCVIKAGGTASTASSEISIAGGTAIASLVKGFTIKGTRALATERYGTGSTKSEQKANGDFDITVDLDAEFNTQAELYDVFRAGTVVPLQFTFTGSLITGSNYNLFDIIVPGCKYQEAEAADNEQDLVGMPVSLTAFDDGTNALAQIKLISTDTTL